MSLLVFFLVLVETKRLNLWRIVSNTIQQGQPIGLSNLAYGLPIQEKIKLLNKAYSIFNPTKGSLLDYGIMTR